MKLAIVFISTFVTIRAVQFNVRNNHGIEIWIGIQGAANNTHLNDGGFILSPGQERPVNAPDDWSGRFWARTWCDGGSNHCESGDCGGRDCEGRRGDPPVTCVEITLNASDGQDYYDVSLVDGFNSKASIEPVVGDQQRNDSQHICTKATCQNLDILNQCPEDYKKYGNSGKVVGCKSECMVHPSDENCCTGSYNSPDKCRAPGFARFFKNRCPKAYSYAYDDYTSRFTCRAGRYNIVFG